MNFQPDVEKTDALFNELEFRRMAEQFDSIFKKGTSGADTKTLMIQIIQTTPRAFGTKNEDQFDLLVVYRGQEALQVTNHTIH
jgi:DNA polymerase-1